VETSTAAINFIEFSVRKGIFYAHSIMALCAKKQDKCAMGHADSPT
jgi:hypothetical protein